MYHSPHALLGKGEDNIGWFKILRTGETVNQRVPAGKHEDHIESLAGKYVLVMLEPRVCGGNRMGIMDQLV